MRILVTGGAGYIGATTAHRLKDAGFLPVIVDDFSKGHRSFVDGMEIFEADITDSTSLARAFEEPIDAVIHFAALSEVGESVRDPLSFYRTNVGGTANLLSAMREAGVNKIVFSSSAAVYGAPEKTPIREAAPFDPISPYGATKVAVERMLWDCEKAFGLKWVALRYFNAAGADPSLRCGEWHEPETHLIPNVLKAAAGKKGHLELFGVHHPTADGSAIRDYVHVSDLADAHILALEKLGRENFRVYNLGIGRGFSVKEVIDAARRVTGKEIEVVEKPIRQGDPPVLVADSRRAKKELLWKPKYDDVESIVESAWQWYSKRGFGPHPRPLSKYLERGVRKEGAK